jgi:hypothetical protein
MKDDNEGLCDSTDRLIEKTGLVGGNGWGEGSKDYVEYGVK